MHLLASKPGGFVDDEGIVDLQQTPADLVILSAADSSLASLAKAVDLLPPDFPSVRLANWLQLAKPAAFDLYRDKVLDHAKVVVVSLLGGKNYWPYGFEQLLEWLSEASPHKPRQLIIVPGDDSSDPELTQASSVSSEQVHRVWRYLREGGVTNAQQLFNFIGSEFLGAEYAWGEPQALPPCLLYMPVPDQQSLHYGQATLTEWQQRWAQNVSLSAQKVQPVCLLLFYRSHLQSANTQMFDGLIECLEDNGINPLPVALTSLKDADSLRLINSLIEQTSATLVINTTSFASNSVSTPELSSQPTLYQSSFEKPLPVLQLVLSSSTEDDWLEHSQGLRSRDIAMQVVLPEMDGRIITRAVSFKAESHFCERGEISVVSYALQAERAVFVAQLAKRYCALASKPNAEKRIALMLANYPTRDGRIGNGVGLDTPASTINILRALEQVGYPISDVPETGNQLIEELLGAVTNNPATLHQLPCWQSISVDEYLSHFQRLPAACQLAVTQQWGSPDQDPKCRQGRLMIAGIRLGETFVGIQPARGFNMDLQANYHDPDLVPPHSYLACYFWLRESYQVDAVIHVGKHGNLEWLPGKGLGLSQSCWPDIALGPLPHFYPFIVNDPGEGAQAKRRAQATIIDHLMPPMTRAESYGELAELENLVDEYYQALGMDTRRETWLREQILEQVKVTHVLDELSLSSAGEQAEEEVLSELDGYLCEIKEAQIRHGLHILGELPDASKLTDTVVALLRLPRGEEPAGLGILHALAADLALGDEGADPLALDHAVWQGAKPLILADLTDSSWRTGADTRERLELLAQQWVAQYVVGDEHAESLALDFPHTSRLLSYAKQVLMAALEQSAELEISSLLKGLNGQFVEPGPSGAPTRGRLDTLPTGRNFFSVDNRSIPSPAAWALGQLSAQALIERHLQEYGDYPQQLGLSVWGTATMRTGGDDIAQAFALMGIKPIWAQGSQRVVDFEIIPAMLLQRPRVDVTLRVSGFFRDAFPNVIKLFDAAVLALAEFDEPGQDNRIRTHIEKRQQVLLDEGMTENEALRQASYRVFGSKPGAYGAGLQGLIDERCWDEQSDLAEAYLNWGGYAYGRHDLSANAEVENFYGIEAQSSFRHQLSQLEAVVQNQDNREHDLLDSDDYYQFQGGMTNAVTVLKGEAPAVYHSDHSNPSVPKIRTLKEELNRVVRSRLLNPKWINAMQEHGYKGAFEMAASVDYLFAYDATTNLIDDYQYEKVADALVFDQVNQQFLQDNNPNALEEMAERLLEATQRGLWQEPGDYADQLQSLLLQLDEQQEMSS